MVAAARRWPCRRRWRRRRPGGGIEPIRPTLEDVFVCSWRRRPRGGGGRTRCGCAPGSSRGRSSSRSRATGARWGWSSCCPAHAHPLRLRHQLRPAARAPVSRTRTAPGIAPPRGRLRPRARTSTLVADARVPGRGDARAGPGEVRAVLGSPGYGADPPRGAPRSFKSSSTAPTPRPRPPPSPRRLHHPGTLRAITLEAYRPRGGLAREGVPPSTPAPASGTTPSRKHELIVPGLIAVILTTLSALLTALTVVRERERGTIEQLICSPRSAAPGSCSARSCPTSPSPFAT